MLILLGISKKKKKKKKIQTDLYESNRRNHATKICKISVNIALHCVGEYSCKIDVKLWMNYARQSNEPL